MNRKGCRLTDTYVSEEGREKSLRGKEKEGCWWLREYGRFLSSLDQGTN